MDLFLIIVIFIVFCVLFSICGWCCKKHREGTVYGFAAPAVQQVTVPAYPVHGTQQPQPVAGYPGYQQSGPYPVPGATPYQQPNQTSGFYPMPMPAGTGGCYPPAPAATAYPGAGPPYPVSNPPYPVAAPYPTGGGAPYPAVATGGVQQLPPSYMEAVGQPAPTTNEGYVKQAPYNPHY